MWIYVNDIAMDVPGDAWYFSMINENELQWRLGSGSNSVILLF